MTHAQDTSSKTASLTGKRIHFVGGGNMAQALISGLLAKGIKPSAITVADPALSIREQLALKKIAAFDPLSIASAMSSGSEKTAEMALAEADVVILAVKPQMMAKVVAGFDKSLDTQLVISVAAGLSLATLSKMLGGYTHIVRAMPNTPAMIQKGATGLYADAHISDSQRELAGDIMASAGLVSWVDKEALLHAVTAISGSAPAYFFYMIESMVRAGVAQGLDEKQAAALAMQTALGAAEMAITSEETPADLRRKVTSPNGTTHAAVLSLQADAFEDVISKAMQACYARSEALSESLSQLLD